jgi:hypothetical protein
MREKIVFALMVGVCMLTGCASETEILTQLLEDEVIESAGIEKNEDYQKYMELTQAGSLNEAGEYDGFEDEDYQLVASDATKQVHVTIAQNSFLDIDYYYDQELTDEITEASVYLNPGDKIYCSQPQPQNNNSNTYKFSAFQIYEFNEDGTRGNLWETTGEDSLVLEIPEDYKGVELSIMPEGVYEQRQLEFNAFYYDVDGTIKNPYGKWIVNNEVYPGNAASIDATESYTVSYEFDSELYYCDKEDTNPEAFNIDSSAGKVEFQRATATEDTDTYSVQLHKFITVDFSYDNKSDKGIAKIEKVNSNNEKEDLDTKQITGLKEGDTLNITTEDNYQLFCSEIEIANPNVVDGGYQYEVVIPESSEFCVTNYEIKVAKSELTVTLDDSVGYDMKFGIEAAGINEKNLHYSKKSLNQDKTIYTGTIGVEGALRITVDDDELEKNYALKFDIEKTDGNSQKTSEIKYISAIPGSVEIDLYGNERITNLDKIYNKITVKISKVEVVTFESKQISNAELEVELGSEELMDGEIAEGNRKVTVTITPDAGYYVAGKNVKNDIYSKTMKLSEYESKIDDIIKNHAIRKFISLTLENNDSYGKVTYMLNGDEKTGTIQARIEDKLELTYELTDENYSIVRESEGFLGSVDDWRKETFSANKESRTIPLTEELDGTTLKRSDYIKIEKK